MNVHIRVALFIITKKSKINQKQREGNNKEEKSMTLKTKKGNRKKRKSLNPRDGSLKISVKLIGFY